MDLTDYAVLRGCLTGPGGGILPGCDGADLNDDGDVDLRDAGVFQSAFTGA